jgi:hypothetical protein
MISKTFDLNINSTSHKKHKTYKDRYKKSLPTICNHKLKHDYETGESICVICYEICDRIMITENFKCKNSDILIWDRQYDKTRWIKETVEYLKGEHNDRFCDVFWHDMLVEIPNPCTWKDVYQVFHNYKLTDYWLCFASYVGITFPNDKYVIEQTIQYSYLGYTKYSISFLYLMYKFTQMKSEVESTHIPFKASIAWIKKTDEWWKTICSEHHWSYHESKVNKVSWPKKHIVDSLAIIIQNL